jgi:N-acyl-phosphatidylethanolamine-hydrolysing phospholipase D
MPIGSYCPRWHLRQQHCDPQDVIQMHLELGAKKTVGVHYATWILSDEHYLAPQTELANAARETRLCRRVMAGQMGRTTVIPWEKVESSEDESRRLDEEKSETDELVLMEARGGKCVIWS